MADAARQLGGMDVGDTLGMATTLAVELVGGCEAAAVTLVKRRRQLETPAYSGDMAARGDLLQYEVGEGPCIDAVWQEQFVISADLVEEDRWPLWAPRVVEELGARSMMCVQLFTSEDTLGALNLYSSQRDAFHDHQDRYEAEALAAHVALALFSAQQTEGLHAALVTRTIIGQAEGILMERFSLDADRAFQVLRRISSRHNTKLHQVAADLVGTRQVPRP